MANPTAITAYYASLDAFRHQDVSHEQAIRLAFATLLDTHAREAKWTLVQEQKLLNRRRPDGTLFDAFRLPRGYWEAKDTQDDLQSEIQKKIRVGYPLTNTIFEDSRRAVLYQQGRPIFDADLTKQTDLAALLDRFFAHTGAEIEQFHQAVREFQDRIPELAKGLLETIEMERKSNKAFVSAFSRFHDLCKKALNPNIAVAAIDEMLVQHLLTERLFRTVFGNTSFTRRNAIAAEVEKVIDALTSRSFDRAEFMRALDYFYKAIEDTARTIDDWSEKQGFLNTIYERFFQGYSVRQADTHGIVYTPQPIVDFMCASVEEVLKTEFGTSLSTPGVKILDPCVGTGNFIVNLLRRIEPRHLKRKYAEDLFCNEVMLLPYYIASLNIEHAYLERTKEYAPFEGISFADTLDLVDAPQLSFLTEANSARVERQKAADITVIIGNPPYSAGQQNENDNNQNRKYPNVDAQIKSTYIKASRATLTNKLYDAYVRFFRWATDRLAGKPGIVCFVSNNGFLDGIAFDGFRKELVNHFDTIYHLNLRGNARTSAERRRDEGGNIFEDKVRVGVGITVLARTRSSTNRRLQYFPVDKRRTAAQKREFLIQAGALSGVDWEMLVPDAKGAWLTAGLANDFERHPPVGSKAAKAGGVAAGDVLFRTYSLGVVTNRDAHIYDFDGEVLASRTRTAIDIYSSVLARDSVTKPTSRDETFIDVSDPRIKWTRQVKAALGRRQRTTFDAGAVREALYRPYARKKLYFDPFWNEEQYQQPRIFPTSESRHQNVAICLTVLGSEKPFMALVTNVIPDLHLVGAGSGAQCFPLYTYSQDGTNRRDNITDWALSQYQSRYGPTVTKLDIFHYTYALLHHPDYRTKYAENLKRELPRIPFVATPEDFRSFATAGERLAQLHLHYEQQPEYKLDWVQNSDIPWSTRVTKMKLSPEKDLLVVNPSLTLAGIPKAAFDYRLGNRSALEWVIDQYQVKTDPRSGITSDPNRSDDQEYIVRLVAKVITVSLETTMLVSSLPPLHLEEPRQAPDRASRAKKPRSKSRPS